LAATLGVACGGNSVDPSGADGGRAGARGSGPGSGGSGAEPATPAAVGLTISLTQPSSAEVPDLGSRACSAGDSGSHTYTLGSPAPGRTITSGTNGVEVTCTVKPSASGDAFDVSAMISGADNVGLEKFSLDIAGAVTRIDTTASSPDDQLTFYTGSTLTLETRSPYPSCRIGPVTTLKSGAMLADFSCPVLVSTTESAIGCKATGTLAIEYCTAE
jgi:hypothetical protein